MPLKKCPFCASDNTRIIKEGGDMFTFHRGYCDDCNASGPKEMGAENAELIWNIRRRKKTRET